MTGPLGHLGRYPSNVELNRGLNCMAKNAQRKRFNLLRLVRFSLKAFLATVIVFGLVAGIFFQRVNSQKNAVNWIESHGGSCIYDFAWHGKNAFGRNMPANWIVDFLGVDFFANVYQVDLDDCQLESMDKLSQIKNLKRLYLRNSNVDDLGFIEQHKGLEDLCISGTNISDISPIAHLTDLIFLQMIDTPAKDVSCLAELKQLHSVTLPNNIDEKQIENLKRELPNCKFCTYVDGYHIDF